MSSTIPPLVCNTPPPIDFDHDDDDVCFEGIDSAFSPSEDDVSLPATPKHNKVNKKHAEHVAIRELLSSVADDESNITIVLQYDAISTDLGVNDASVSDSITDKEIIINENDKVSTNHVDSIEYECAKGIERREAENEKQIGSDSIQVVIESPPLDDDYDRNESPPSLELATGKYSDNECDTNEVNDEFDDFQRNSNELSVDIDTTSLPSLNFDSIRNSPDFKSDEIDDKNSEPDDVSVEKVQPMISDEEVTGTSNELFEAEVSPSLEASPEPESSTTFDPIETADVIPAVAAVGDDLSSENIAFDADFSQFAAFESENEVQQQPSIETIEQQPYVKSKPIDDDFDDDFGDFEEAPTKSNTNEAKNIPQDAAADLDDDDFGDFNDFQQDTASVSATIHTPLAEISKSSSFDLKSISERFSSILDTAFPTNGDDNEDTSCTSSNHVISPNKIENFNNGTTTHLKNFENAKALQHQWANSTSKSVLIKALGIDERNIMYGENWKSPLPRFAANLGYVALEPLKPTAVDNSSVRYSSNSNIATATQIKSKENVIASNTEAAIETERSPEVPAVQFDWSSAGLVNPLDASQAHTLLLDLEQLVVMENLDKIKLDCSSSSSSSTCNASASSASSLNSTTNNNTNNSTKLRTLFGTVKSSAASIIDSTLPKMQKTGQNPDGFINQTTASFGRSTSNALNGLLFNHAKSTQNNNVLLVVENAYQMDQPFDPYFDISPQEIVHKADTAETQLSRIDVDRKKSSIEIDSTSGECSASEIILSSAASLPKSTTIPTAIPKGTTTQQYEMSPADLVTSLNDFEPTSQSASYSVPGSSGTLKETHIFTPNKMNITSNHVPSMSNQIDVCDVTAASAPNAYPEFDFEKANAGVIINESVVKKEYRDVEYDPDKLKTNANIDSDDFSEFQSVEAPAIETKSTLLNNLTSILQPTKTTTNISIDWPDPGNVTDANAMNEFKNYVPNQSFASSKVEESNDVCVKHSTTNGYGFNKPTIGTSPSDDMFSESNNVADTRNGDDGFSEFQTTKTAGLGYISHISAIPDIIPTGQSFAYVKTDITPKSMIFQRVSLASDMGIDKYSDSKMKHSNDIRTVTSHIDVTTTLTSTNSNVPPFAGSSILIPQITSQPKQASAPNHVSAIAWPDPGISADELARLETIFPQTNNKTVNASQIKSQTTKNANSKAEEDEWSDFVSVTQPQTPITNILNQNLQKHQNNDDDDWSDFISSTASPPSLTPMQTQLTNNDPNFNSWNAPLQYSSWQHTAPSPMVFSQSDNFTLSPMRSLGNGITNGNHQAPSIISLPNLGFAAPKSLVNMPKSNIAKK